MRAFLLFLFVAVSYRSVGQKAADTVGHAKKLVNFDLQISGNDFCQMVIAFVGEAGENFENIKGKGIESDGSSVMYTALRGIPGSVMSNIVEDPESTAYEGVLYQGKSKDEMAKVYGSYDVQIDNCLAHKSGVTQKGTSVRTEDESGLEKFPNTVYGMGKVSAGLKVDHSSINGIYTVTLYVEKHLNK